MDKKVVANIALFKQGNRKYTSDAEEANRRIEDKSFESIQKKGRLKKYTKEC